MVGVQVLIGFLMLLLGRWNYAIFTGGVVFYLTGIVTTVLVPEQDPLYSLAIAAVAAFLAGFACYVFKRITAYSALFLAAGMMIYNLVTAYDWDQILISWQAFVIAGILCVGAGLAAFDFGVVLISTLAGASLVVLNVSLPAPFSGIIWFITLVIFGLIVQYVLLQYSKPTPD